MTALSVNRIIERQSATGGDRIAIEEGDLTLTYRELNQRANAVARELISRGLRRGSDVVTRMQRGPELAMVLLAILKAGAAYTWMDVQDADRRWPYGVSFAKDGVPRAMPIDIGTLMVPSRHVPNLPIVTRGDDIACVLRQPNGLPGVLVPHATIASLQAHPIPERAPWSDDAAALDLWLPLMAGATVTLAAAPTRVAAA
jgi:hypothetical protein